MKSKLFLTGPSGCGKTTMIKNTLGNNFEAAGGFVTCRVCNERGVLLGFDLLPAAAMAGAEGFTPARFLDCSVFPPKNDNEVFRNEAVRLLSEAEYYPFAVLDEIGGFELLIPEFRAALADFLSSDTPCIGVFKGDENSFELQSRLGLSDRFLSCRQQVLGVMKKYEDIHIIEVTGRNDAEAINAVKSWCERFCR